MALIVGGRDGYWGNNLNSFYVIANCIGREIKG